MSKNINQKNPKSFLETIAGESKTLIDLGFYMLNIENQLNLFFTADSSLNLEDLSRVLESTKADDLSDHQVLKLLEHSAILEVRKAIKLFSMLQKKVSLEKYLPMTGGLLKDRLQFYTRVERWRSLYKNCRDPLGQIIDKKRVAMVFQ